LFAHAWLGNGGWVLANGLFGLNSAIGFTFENNDSVLSGTTLLRCDSGFKLQAAGSKVVEVLFLQPEACGLQPISRTLN
jgi:hypothetical protein